MYCPHCGNPLPEHARACTVCGKSLDANAPAASSAGNEVVSTLIPYKNSPALVGYYLGVFSLVPFLGLPLGIAAIILGFFGLKKHRLNPSAKGKAHAWVAIICGSISVLLWGGLLLFGVIAAASS